jgi:hypothetical protein
MANTAGKPKPSTDKPKEKKSSKNTKANIAKSKSEANKSRPSSDLAKKKVKAPQFDTAKGGGKTFNKNQPGGTPSKSSKPKTKKDIAKSNQEKNIKKLKDGPKVAKPKAPQFDPNKGGKKGDSKKEMSFNDAFKKARKEKGKDATFTYKGKSYSTVTMDDVKAAGFNTLREYLNSKK